MALIKCPRCELNYIKEYEELCSVCRREMGLEPFVEVVIDLCSECNEAPAVDESGLCAHCLREMEKLEMLERMNDAPDTVDDDDDDDDMLDGEKLENDDMGSKVDDEDFIDELDDDDKEDDEEENDM